MKRCNPGHVLVLLAVSLHCGCAAVAQSQTDTTDLDPAAIYRVQPGGDGAEMIAVPAEDLKPGMVYNYYNSGLGRRAWGFATEDGSFQYAFGEGTTVPTNRFDFRIAASERSAILERESPGLERDVEISGRPPVVQLTASGNWRLARVTSPTRVFDVETGRRWEWHGGRRLTVLHTHGDLWSIVDGRYQPATAWYATASHCANCRAPLASPAPCAYCE
jgi:hypothetical protein